MIICIYDYIHRDVEGPLESLVDLVHFNCVKMMMSLKLQSVRLRGGRCWAKNFFLQESMFGPKSGLV